MASPSVAVAVSFCTPGWVQVAVTVSAWACTVTSWVWVSSTMHTKWNRTCPSSSHSTSSLSHRWPSAGTAALRVYVLL